MNIIKTHLPDLIHTHLHSFCAQPKNKNTIHTYLSISMVIWCFIVLAPSRISI
ncbi:hypothetical protein Hanom_Chr10g00928851 [Helianthus anomalus]